MNAREFDPRMLWRFTATVGEAANQRFPSSGPNPYRVNTHYTGALFQLRAIEITGLITVNRVLIYGSNAVNGFGALGQGIADQHVIARWIGGLGLNTGQLRQPKLVDTTIAPISRRAGRLVPGFLLLEWNTNPAGDPGATKTFELWASFTGPEVRGVA